MPMATTTQMTIQKNKQAAMSVEGQESDRLHRQNLRDAAAAEARETAERKAEAAAAKHPAVRALSSFVDFVNGMACQTILYMVFVGIFQSLTSTMRLRSEFFL